MESKELERKLIAYGADMEGIEDRFMGDDELYMDCLRSFLDDKYFAALDKALREKDYASAFVAVHTLKGVSGNMGLPPLCDAIVALTESLRAKQYEHVAEQYQDIVKRLAEVKALL